MESDNFALKILVVEDSKVAMATLCKALRKMGVQHISTAGQGLEALEIFRKDRPDIVLLDGLLPDIDGFEVARRMRAIEGGKAWSAIIFLTGMDNDEDLARGIQAGGDDYLKKPVNPIVLHAKINAMRRIVEMQHANADITRQLNEANRQLQEFNKELQIQSSTDQLTGISNRRVFDESLIKEWKRCERLKMPLSLVMMDVDFFKQFNDNYGHQAGDRCLKEVASQLAHSVGRPGDLAARYGGEEFALILSLTDIESACYIANRARENVSALGIAHTASTTQCITVSCGVSSIIPDEQCSVETLIKTADEALYQAKRQGRNKVVCLSKQPQKFEFLI
jgi:diguanylate cyclase (GGDEF)-like protein